MNCDDVLQHLTGKQATERTEPLDRHLAECASCREMAELFKPAVAILEITREATSADMVSRWDRICDAINVAESAANELKNQAIPRTAWPITLLRSAAILVLGVVIGIAAERATPSSAESSAAGSVASPLSGNRAGMLQMVASQPATCGRLVLELEAAVLKSQCPICEQPLPSRASMVVACRVCHFAQDSSQDRLPLDEPSRMPRS